MSLGQTSLAVLAGAALIVAGVLVCWGAGAALMAAGVILLVAAVLLYDPASKAKAKAKP